MSSGSHRAKPEATIIDAGVGNLGNLARALARLGAEAEITSDPARIVASRRLLLPGVGAFAPPRERLRGAMEEALREALAGGGWLLGICVGFQLLFEAGEEFGTTRGLGLLRGRVTHLPSGVPLPHIGWNRLELSRGVANAGEPGTGLFAGIADGSYVYFVHSYAPEGLDPGDVLATSTHGRTFPAAAGRGRVLGAQFHPEKSGEVGLRILANFLAMSQAGSGPPFRAGSGPPFRESAVRRAELAGRSDG